MNKKGVWKRVEFKNKQCSIQSEQITLYTTISVLLYQSDSNYFGESVYDSQFECNVGEIFKWNLLVVQQLRQCENQFYNHPLLYYSIQITWAIVVHTANNRQCDTCMNISIFFKLQLLCINAEIENSLRLFMRHFYRVLHHLTSDQF